MNPGFIKAKIQSLDFLYVNIATESSNSTSAISGKVVALAFIVFVGGVASGIFLIQLQNNNANSSTQEEILDVTNQHVWCNQTGWAEAAVVVTNAGEKDVVLRKITIRGVECSWGNVYYWKTDTGPVSSELEQTLIELSGSSFDILIDGTQQTFQQATTEPTLRSGWTIVLYIKQPYNITLSDDGSKVIIAVFTYDKLYYTEAYVVAQQIEAGGAILDVENIYWNATAKTTSIAVKNIGTSDAKIVRLYIGSTVSNLLEVTVNTDLSTAGRLLAVDQTITIVLDWPNNLASSWTSGKTYYFKIAPEAGAPKEFTWKSPSA